MYGKIINNELFYAPDNYTTSDGTVISNFTSNPTIMLQYGYKKIVEDIPEDYDSSTQTLFISSHSENETDLFIYYATKPKTTGDGYVSINIDNIIDDENISKKRTYSSYFIDNTFAKKNTVYQYDDSQIVKRLDNLETNTVSSTEIYTQQAQIDELKSNFASIKNLNVENLDSLNANITQLQSNYAEINTLVSGNLTADNFQSMIISGSKFTVDNGFIKNAMIESISVDKLLAGTINTSLINLQSEDGGLTINGNLQQFKDSEGNVRIQIGKDSSGNFTFVLYDENGEGVLLDETGIKSSAISDGLIVDKMVADNANIAGSKLDINSVVTEVNNGTSVINGSKIKLDDSEQTLDVDFSTFKTEFEDNKTQVNTKIESNTTDLKVAQGNIQTLISNTTITDDEGNSVQLKDKYTALEQTVTGINSTVSEHTSSINSNTNNITNISSKYTTLSEDLNGFTTRVSSVESTNATNTSDISELKQNVNKISTTIKSTESKTVSKVEMLYYVSTSTTELIGGEWSTESPTWEAGKYIWNKTKTYYINEDIDPIETDPVCITGAKGDKGDKGDTGEQGIQGIQGIQGEQGDQGIQGEQGEKGDKGDTGEPGAKGDKGDTGEQGVSVEEVIIQYAKNNSTSTAPTSGWSTEMPSYAEGYYLWIRTRVKYSNSTSYVYSTAVCDQSWKASSECYSEYNQLKDKFSWIVTNGSTSTSLTITDQMISAIANSDIELSAKKILINGLLAGTGWSVDEEGNLDINDLNIRGDITCDGANFTSINCPTVVQCLSNNATIASNTTGATLSLNGDTLVGGSIMECLGHVPKNLGGYTLTINLNNDINENIELGGFYNGYLTFNFGDYKIIGNLFISYNNAKIQLNDVTIMPYCGVKAPDGDNYWYAILLQDAPNVDINKADIYGDNTNTNKVGIGLYNKSCLTMNDVNFYKCKNHVRNKELSRLYCASSTGLSSSYSWVGFSGSLTFLYPSTQAGGQGSGTYPDKVAYNNSQIYYNNVEFCNSANRGSNTTTSDDTTEENNTSTSIKTLTCNPNYADAYRHTVYNNWKKDGVARQGDYGYGDCEGFFFYGTQFEAVEGKDITKVEITLKRNSNAGYNTSVSHGVTYHGYTVRTSSEPSGTQTGETISLACGESGTVTITNSTVLNGIKNGTIKGFGIKATYDKAHYSSVSNGVVKIYYKG